jgi:hypothetical protein
MSRKEPRLRIPVALTVAIIAAGAATYGCKTQNQCSSTVGTIGGGPSNPTGGAGGVGGSGGAVDCMTSTGTDIA